VTARAERLRRGLGVDVGAALNLVGVLVKYLALAFAFPVVVALAYGETPWPFLASGAITAALGWSIQLVTQGKERVSVREGFLVVASTWLFAAAVGALPFLLANEPQLESPMNAYFESMSGFTTTGASVLTDIDAVSRSLLMWRQFTQWLGGMGIIVLALAVLPRLRVGGRQLLESELPGPEFEPLATSIRHTARRLWSVYVALTALQIGILAVLGWTGVDEAMSFFDAVAHAFTTMPTGGFSTKPRSIEDFGAATQWTIVAFMLLAGANFALLYRALVRRHPGAYARDAEFRLYAGLLVLGSAVILLELLHAGLYTGEEALRHAVFQAVSIMTTTGYSSVDFSLWTAAAPLTVMVLVALMFAGGSAGSTAGSIKIVRHLLIGRILRRELDQTLHPEVVAPVRLNRRTVDERTLRAVISFVLLYVGIFVVGALLLVIESTRAGIAVTPFEAIAAAATTLGNVGPGLGFAGPVGSFEPFSDVSKGIMIALMWLGRLELIPVIVLFTRAYWRA
jgi:trk system potassium uptake protein